MCVGKSLSEASAQIALRYRYDEDGDVIESWFTEAFQIFHIDEDFTELLFDENYRKLIRVFGKSASYAEHFASLVISDIEKLEKSPNIIYSVYNYGFSGEILEAHGENIEVRFLGNYPCKEVNL